MDNYKVLGFRSLLNKNFLLSFFFFFLKQWPCYTCFLEPRRGRDRDYITVFLITYPMLGKMINNMLNEYLLKE